MLTVRDRPRAGYFFAKRLFDVVFSLLTLLLLSPLLGIIAFTISVTSSGPVLYQQQRFGRNGKVFYVLKFRTMRLESCDSTAQLQTKANDPRITTVGRVLRRYNLDEYPQLINILKGDMSLVGPRPHAIGMLVLGVPYADIVPDHDLRHSVRPGLTGLAQANGAVGPIANSDEALRRHAYDLRYLEVMSFSKDLVIILQTIGAHLLALFASLSVSGLYAPDTANATMVTMVEKRVTSPQLNISVEVIMGIKSRASILAIGLALVASAGFGVKAERALAQDQTIDAATCSTEEECACLQALNANTVEALEAYLQQYPPGGGGEGSACATLAFDALQSLTTDEDAALADAQDNDPLINIGSPN